MVTPKMSKKGLENVKPVVGEAVPYECPFREFRDNELQIDTWGLVRLGILESSCHYLLMNMRYIQN